MSDLGARAVSRPAAGRRRLARGRAGLGHRARELRHGDRRAHHLAPLQRAPSLEREYPGIIHLLPILLPSALVIVLGLALTAVLLLA